jgi:hypothetical protein
MTAEEHVIAAMRAELERQAATSDGAFTVQSRAGDDRVVVRGAVDLAALAMVAVGSLAGGP